MKIRKAKNANARVKLRRERYDTMSAETKRGQKRPGSQNPHKGK